MTPSSEFVIISKLSIKSKLHLISPSVFSGVRVTRSLVLCVCFVGCCLFFVLFLLAIGLSVLLRYTDYVYSFGIFKLFLYFHILNLENCRCDLGEILYLFREKNCLLFNLIRVITKLPNSEQSYKGKVKTHKYINRQNQSTTRKL